MASFTEDEDVQILMFLRRAMSPEEEKELRALCGNKSMRDIRHRARELAKKFIDDGVYDLEDFPGISKTAELREYADKRKRATKDLNEYLVETKKDLS